MAHLGETKESYEFFYGTESPYSNWRRCNFVLPHPVNPNEKIVYSCAEQRMMHMKAHIFGDLAAGGRILSTKCPKTQKSIGRKVKGYDDKKWESVRRGVVKEALIAKFGQNPSLMNKMLSVSRPFVEASPTDRIWGIGLKASDPRAQRKSTWNGLNLLGEILTEVRDEFLAKGWRSHPSGIPRKAAHRT